MGDNFSLSFICLRYGGAGLDGKQQARRRTNCIGRTANKHDADQSHSHRHTHLVSQSVTQTTKQTNKEKSSSSAANRPNKLIICIFQALATPQPGRATSAINTSNHRLMEAKGKRYIKIDWHESSVAAGLSFDCQAGPTPTCCWLPNRSKSICT